MISFKIKREHRGGEGNVEKNNLYFIGVYSFGGVPVGAKKRQHE